MLMSHLSHKVREMERKRMKNMYILISLTIAAFCIPSLQMTAVANENWATHQHPDGKNHQHHGNGNVNVNGNGNGKQKEKHQGQVSSTNRTRQSTIEMSLNVGTARDLASRYQVKSGKALPPGIRKQLARGKPLPPGIAKKISNPDFIAALPHYPDHEWQMCGTDLVLVAVATAVIVDVLFDVF